MGQDSFRELMNIYMKINLYWKGGDDHEEESLCQTGICESLGGSIQADLRDHGKGRDQHLGLYSGSNRNEIVNSKIKYQIRNHE